MNSFFVTSLIKKFSRDKSQSDYLSVNINMIIVLLAQGGFHPQLNVEVSL